MNTHKKISKISLKTWMTLLNMKQMALITFVNIYIEKHKFGTAGKFEVQQKFENFTTILKIVLKKLAN